MNNESLFKLYEQLSTLPGNVICSPKNILECLLMLYPAARGETATAFEQTCGFTANTISEVESVNQKLMSQKACEVSMASGLWVQNDYKLNPEYLKSIGSFGDNLSLVNYKDQANHSKIAEEINEWVEQQTKKKIRNLVSADFFDTSVLMTLVTAIYFLGKWKTMFSKTSTLEAPFFVGEDERKPCQLMRQTVTVPYMEQKDFLQVVSLPYVGNELQMLIVLPKAVNTRPEQLLRHSDFNTMIALLKPEKTQIYLPKFKLEAKYQLNQPLIDLGLGVAFSGQANFTGLTEEGSNDVKIGRVVHKAFIDVTEEGTEAAAATAATMMRSCAIERPHLFRADHPFAFAIWDTNSKSVLFLGRMSSPEGY